MYLVLINKSAKKTLDKIPANYQNNIAQHIEELSTDPHPQGSIKMKGSNNTYRLRVGVYRIIYDVFDTELIIKVITIDHRKDVYK